MTFSWWWYPTESQTFLKVGKMASLQLERNSLESSKYFLTAWLFLDAHWGPRDSSLQGTDKKEEIDKIRPHLKSLLDWRSTCRYWLSDSFLCSTWLMLPMANVISDQYTTHINSGDVSARWMSDDGSDGCPRTVRVLEQLHPSHQFVAASAVNHSGPTCLCITIARLVT